MQGHINPATHVQCVKATNTAMMVQPVVPAVTQPMVTPTVEHRVLITPVCPAVKCHAVLVNTYQKQVVHVET
jgi:hypothetical protein